MRASILLSLLLLTTLSTLACEGPATADPNGKAAPKVTNSVSAAEYYTRARHAQDNLEDDEALDNFTKALSLTPDDLKARMDRAWLYKNTKRYDEAIIDYKKVLSLSKDKKQIEYAATASADIYKSQHKYKDCMDLLQVAARASSRNQHVLAMSDCARLSGDGNLALKLANEIVKTHPLNGYEQRARALMVLKRPREALVDYNNVIASILTVLRSLDSETQSHVQMLQHLKKAYEERAACHQLLNDTRSAQADRKTAENTLRDMYYDAPFRTKGGK